ncbi:Der1-like domain family member 1 [Cricetulus griseus]
MSDIGDWFRSIPAITRYWFAATVAVPLIGKLGIISPAYFFLWPEAFLYRFQPSVCPHRGSAIPVSGVRLTDLYTGCLHVYSFSLRFIEVV